MAYYTEMDEITWLKQHLYRLEDGLERLIQFAGPQVSYDIECSAVDMMKAIEKFIAERTSVYNPDDGNATICGNE